MYGFLKWNLFKKYTLSVSLFVGTAKYYVAGNDPSLKTYVEVDYEDWTHRDIFWTNYRDSEYLGKPVKVMLCCFLT
jgi:hypothetical protein